MKLVILTLLSCFLSLSASSDNPNGYYHYRSSKTNCLVFIDLPQTNSTTHAWKDFHAAAFDIEKFLKYAQNNSLPLVLLVPDVFCNVSTTEPLAAWHEGARVALAWTSAYYRFNQIQPNQLHILIAHDPYSFSFQSLERAINTLTNSPVLHDTVKTPEENIQNRCLHFSDLLNQKNLEIGVFEPLFFTENKREPFSIEHSLAELNPGQKRYLITGAAGFIGSHLTRDLLQQGQQVIGLDNFLCCSRENLEDLLKNKNFYFFQWDVTEPFSVAGHVDTIVHLASVPSPAFYYAMPIETLKTGLQGTKITLELALEKNAHYVFASTSEVYGDPEISPQDESYCGNVNPIGKRSQYDMSKRGAETLLKLYFDAHALDIRVARIFNTYGPGMQLNDGRVVTNFIRSILKKEPFIIYGSGEQTRSFAYISDTVDGLLKLINAPTITNQTPFNDRIFNIGNQEEFTINALAACMNSVAQAQGYSPAEIEHVTQIDPTDPKLRCPDLTKAKSILQFSPGIDLAQGLEATLLYFAKKNENT